MTADGPAPQRGRICMDMSMIDLSELPNVGVGDEVEIFGPDNPVETLAKLARSARLLQKRPRDRP